MADRPRHRDGRHGRRSTRTRSPWRTAVRRSSGPRTGSSGPGPHFGEFYFDETGDTDATSPENDTAGGWGSVFKLRQSRPVGRPGTLSLFYKADQATASFDNVTFLSKNLVTFVQDAGDTLHGRRTRSTPASSSTSRRTTRDPACVPVRWIAEGRDASATHDSATPTGNDGDNEITGVHVSDGDPTTGGILGAKVPHLNNAEVALVLHPAARGQLHLRGDAEPLTDALRVGSGTGPHPFTSIE